MVNTKALRARDHNHLQFLAKKVKLDLGGLLHMAFTLKLVPLFNVAIVVLLSNPIFVVARHGQWSNEKKISLQNNEDLVINLPGQPNVDFRHYAGYVTVNENSGRALFYWFYEAWTLPEEKPLVLWLNGGPGCSSVGYGATQEIGPFIVSTDGKGLQLNPYSWNREANMLFLESPVGVGFSYSNTTSDYDNLGDDLTANDAYAFLHNWFLKFPSYKNKMFYIAGESYAGKYVPELAGLIQDKNKDPLLHAVVSDETHKTVRDSCDFNSNNTWSNEDCSQAVDEVLRQYKEIDIYSLYTSVCFSNSAFAENKAMEVVFKKTTSNMMPRIMGGYDPCLDDYAKSYYNKPEVQKALHVADGRQLKNWSICNMDVFNGWKQSKVAGWLQEYEGLTFATFRGAGHAVPIFKPSESLAFFTSFLLGESPPSQR
ncbi:Peptidase S10, serine carboxypeptidase [Cynara cardunculus var. scolymus]|uniref:Carboxypeptidase n=1 Tax=Cynara cardunculus var. scolymus TaxID=59895 RepID=A0A103Y1U2_CYNCS|nr:Peptidase S10, serine carboxypeptidase [Cynara cardunculus var. scolymus]